VVAEICFFNVRQHGKGYNEGDYQADIDSGGGGRRRSNIATDMQCATLVTRLLGINVQKLTSLNLVLRR
jgi:hypothetical protein